MIEAALRVGDETDLQCLIHKTVKKKAHHLIKDAYEKSLVNHYTELYRMVEQAVAKAIHLGGAYYEVNNKIGKLAEFQDFTPRVIYQLIQSPIRTAPLTRLVKATCRGRSRQSGKVLQPKH